MPPFPWIRIKISGSAVLTAAARICSASCRNLPTKDLSATGKQFSEFLPNRPKRRLNEDSRHYRTHSGGTRLRSRALADSATPGSGDRGSGTASDSLFRTAGIEGRTCQIDPSVSLSIASLRKNFLIIGKISVAH